MASTLKHLRSSTADKRPTASGLVDGQLAINTASGTPALFFKDNNGGVVKVGPAHVGASAPNAVPAGSAGNSLGELWVDNSLTTAGLNYYTGSAFVNLTPSGTTTTVGLVELATPAETQTGTDAVRAVTPSGLQSKVSDSTSTTSSTTIASSTAVKSAYDLANAALPKAGGTLTGELLIGTTGSLVFEGSSDDSFETTIAVTNPTADHTITFPNVTGTVVTTGDSGTVTSTMIANDTIVNADINSAAAIVDTKLATISTADKVSASALNIDGATDIGGALENGDLFIVDDGAGGTNRKASAFRVSQLTYSGVTGDITIASGGTSAISTGVIVNADVNSSAAIDFSKLASLTSANILLGNASNVATSTAVTGDVTISNAGVTAISSGVIVNADVNASAAIAGTKISPDFGSQTITTTGVVSAALGAAATPSITFTGDLNTGIYSPGADQVAVATNGSARLYIASDGKVGVGTSSPDELLTVASGTDRVGVNVSGTVSTLLIGNRNPATSCSSISFDRGDGSLRFNNGVTGAITERARIDSSGRLGIGTSAPADALHLASGNFRLTNGGGFSTANSLIRSISSFAGSANQFETTRISSLTGAFSNRGEIAFSTGDDTSTCVEKVRIDYLGRVGIGTTSPNQLLHLKSSTAANTYTLYENPNSQTYVGVNSAGDAILFNDTAGRSVFFATAGLERGRFDASGRFLVGTSSYSGNSAFVIKGGAAQNVGLIDVRYGTTRPTGADIQLSEIRFGSTDFTSNSAYANIQCLTDGASSSDADIPGRLVFSTCSDGSASPQERMRIKNDGEVLINKTSSFAVAHKFAVEASNQVVGIGTGSGTGLEAVRFYNGGTAVGTISTTASSTAYNTSSDYRLKENVTTVTDGIARLQQLKPSRFNFIADPDTVVDGFIAHEVQTVIPEAITGAKDAVDPNGNPVYQGIDQSKLVPLLTAALQEAIGRIETLETEVAALKAQ